MKRAIVAMMLSLATLLTCGFGTTSTPIGADTPEAPAVTSDADLSAHLVRVDHRRTRLYRRAHRLEWAGAAAGAIAYDAASREELAAARKSSPTPVTQPGVGEAPRGVWDQLAGCESGGRWDLNTGTFDGGLQFLPSTWTAYGGGEFAPYAWQASRDQQITVAERVLAAAGWGSWPACSSRLGLR